MMEEPGPNVMDEEELGLVGAGSRCLADIDRLVEVSDQFKETVRLVAFRVLGNTRVRLHLYIMVQLSELGTGMFSSFERGSTQSERRDDVMMDFTTPGGGVGFSLRLRGQTLTLSKWMRQGSIVREIPLHEWSDNGPRKAITSAVDEMLAEWWGED